MNILFALAKKFLKRTTFLDIIVDVNSLSEWLKGIRSIVNSRIGHLRDRMHTVHSYKQRFIAGPSRCSTKPLSILLTIIFSTVEDGLQKYYSTNFSTYICTILHSKFKLKLGEIIRSVFLHKNDSRRYIYINFWYSNYIFWATILLFRLKPIPILV